MEHTGFHTLSTTEIAPAAEVISWAFYYDPLCAFMLPSERSRLKTLLKFFRAYCQVNIQNKQGYGVGEPLKGVAFWLEPNRPDLSVNLRSLGIFLPILFSPYALGYIRARRVLKQVDGLHQKYAPEPHFYLDNIGVLPAEQGRGYSSGLIRPFLEKADQEKVSVYTDTVTERNASFYEHFGFECVEESPVEGTGITIWALCRPVQNV